MLITKIQIKNFRNLDNAIIDFNSKLNFIIGDNNLGKSNFLQLLELLANAKGFSDTDFTVEENPVEISLQLKLVDAEIGFWGDNFSSEDANIINLRVSQNISESYPTLICDDTNETIPLKFLKKIHFINYSTLLNPTKELKTAGRGGASALINSIVKKYSVENGEISVVEKANLEPVSKYINDILAKIHSVNGYELGVGITDNSIDLLPKLLNLKDINGAIEDAGSGVKYITMASVNVLCKILEIYNNKSIKFDDQIYTDADGNKVLPIILGIDEPEVHLNPYTQRSLIKYYLRVLNNEDDDFVQILEQLFGINRLDGQMLVVTHSSDLLMGSYKNIIRFYKKEEAINVVSGQRICLSSSEEKQLLMNFPELRAAFYAKCVIFVEGETEYGCMPLFSKSMGIDFDSYSICLINAEGEKNIAGMRRLLSYFGIDSVAIYDNDVNDNGNTDPNIYYTSELCFESELITELYDKGRIDVARRLVQEMEPLGEKLVLDADFVRKWFKKNNMDISGFRAIKIENIDDDNREQSINLFSAWLYSKKSILMGRLIGEITINELIPQSYVDVICKAKEVALNG